MSKADDIFISTAKDIIENGTSTNGQKVRPHWEDGTPAYTIKKFGYCAKYDLREEFPAMTLRQTYLKSAMDEILWIYQKKSNDINDLKSNIWNEWADSYGTIGKAYGYQVAEKYIHHDNIYMDQMDAVLYDLKNNPFSRRIMINLWNNQELYEMQLQPCCYNVIFNVTDEGGDKLVLNMTLNQRSNDMLTANNWNIAQYAIFLIMVAQCVDMIPGQIMHCITDIHIYDRHVALVKELIERETYPAPKVSLNPEVKDFYKFTTNDLIIEDYEYGPQIKNIPIAI
jgi:thymidylate synthase